MHDETFKKYHCSLKNIFLALVFVVVLVVFIFLGISSRVLIKGKSFVVNASEAQASVVIIPGAGLKRDETPSDVLRDRLTIALALYDDGRVEKILCSGDNGQIQYDEVNAMRLWLLDRGVDAEDIFLDHAGFDTYDTMTRAVEVFGVTGAVVVTQDFHLPRALYVADAKGMAVQGVSASLQPYVAQEAYRMREIPSRVKAFFEVLLNVPPMYLGDAIDIGGDGQVTWDEGL